MRKSCHEAIEGYGKMGRNENEHDLLYELLRETHMLASRGERISFSYLLERPPNELMQRDRSFHLALHPQDCAHGFYSGKLNLSLGKLNLQVPRGPVWKSLQTLLAEL